jgi:hypothetical protein
VPWSTIWGTVSRDLAQHDLDGLQSFLTEDVVRFATMRALVGAGVQPGQLFTEWRSAGPAIDLAVGEPVRAAIEFKFPREPHEMTAA